jgi:hypothetical protein
MSKWHGVGRIVDFGSRSRRADCRLGRKRTSGIGVGRIVEVGSRARTAGWKLGGG